MNNSLVFLAQTDTTVGFLSSDNKKLSYIKKRALSQKIIQVVDRFSTLKKSIRIPKKFRKLIRNSKKTTFIYPNGYAYRVVSKKSQHYDFIKKFKILYSTSANVTNLKFDKAYALDSCDVAIETFEPYVETTSSSIFKITRTGILKYR